MKEKRRESVRRKNRRRKRMKAVLILFSCAALMIGIAILVIFNVFTVETVKVEGNAHYSEEQIQKFVLNDEYSWNSLYVLLKYQFLSVKEVPFVESMEVSLDNPHTLRVHVYEKGIVGYLYIPAIGQNAYFDTDGFVVETSKETIAGIPEVEGLDCEKVVLYEKLPIEEESIFKSLLTATRSLQKNEAVPYKIRFNEAGEISLDYGAVQALLGASDNLAQKILRLSHILPELSGKTGTLHIENWTESTTNIIFEETK